MLNLRQPSLKRCRIPHMATTTLQRRSNPQIPSQAEWDDYVCENLEGWGVTLKDFFDCLRRNDGRMAMVAAELNVPLDDVGRAVKANTILRSTVQLYRELLVDEAEKAVLNAIRGGDSVAAMQTLRTLGKNRGWSERLDAASDEGQKVEVVYVSDWNNPRHPDDEPQLTESVDGEIISESGNSASSSSPSDGEYDSGTPPTISSP